MCTLNSLAQWARQWQLAISIDKCCILNIGKHVSSHHLSLDNCALPIVVVSNNLSPSAHVNDIAARAHKRANMILRTFVLLFVHIWLMSDQLSSTTQLFGHHIL